jgi:N-methylhydantoinase A
MKGNKRLTNSIKEKRMVYFEGSFVDCPIYHRDFLPPEVSILGPAIVEEYSSTTAIFPGWKATTDIYGNVILEAKGNRNEKTK